MRNLSDAGITLFHFAILTCVTPPGLWNKIVLTPEGLQKLAKKCIPIPPYPGGVTHVTNKTPLPISFPLRFYLLIRKTMRLFRIVLLYFYRYDKTKYLYQVTYTFCIRRKIQEVINTASLGHQTT